MKKSAIMLLVVSFLLIITSACTNNKGDETNNNKSDTSSDGAMYSAQEILQKTPDEPITISSSDTNVHVGDEFIVAISIANEEWYWNSFEFTLGYDPSVISITSVTPTELTSEMINMSNLDYSENSVRIAYATAEDMEGGGDIVEITCKALAEGSCDLSISDELMYRFVTVAATNESTVDRIKTSVKYGTVTVSK